MFVVVFVITLFDTHSVKPHAPIIPLNTAMIAEVFTLYTLFKTTSSKNVVFMFFKDLKLVFISLKIAGSVHKR